jgi:phosphate-selective porin
MKRAISCPVLLLAIGLPSAVAWTGMTGQDPPAQETAATKPKKAKDPAKKKKKKKGGNAAAAADATALSPANAEEASPLDKKYVEDFKEKAPKRTFRFEFKKHPAVRIGKWFRADFRLKMQQDFRTFDPEVATDEGEVENLRKFRVGVEGYITKSFEYRVEREIRNEIADLFKMRTRETHALWRDVFVNWRYFKNFQVRAGQFKIPFGMDQLHYSSKGEFVYRSMIGNYLAPGRDQGIMLHGKLSEGRFAYQVGAFIHDGWKGHTADTTDAEGNKIYRYTGERALAGRLVVPPFSFVSLPKFLAPLKDLQLGVAVMESPVTEGLNSLRGRSWVITHNWFTRINVRGHRWRLGTELSWEPGPFTVKGEFITVSDQRLGQGLRGQDLPDLIGRGWYFTTGWVVTGEKTAGEIVPRRNFITGRGIGAIQIAARYEQLRYGSAEHPGLPTRSTRGANLTAESERIATFGVNWYQNRFTRVQFNVLREVIEDIERVPIAGIDTYWSHFVRIQFIF